MLEMIGAEHLARRCQVALGYTAGVPQGGLYAERLADTINDALQRIYRAVKAPQLRLFERRTFRPPWELASGTTWLPGHECYYQGKYYTAKEMVTGGLPPPENPEAWVEKPLGDLVKFIALDQPWELHEIDPAGVDLKAFAFAADPRMSDAEPITACAWMGDYPGGGTSRVLISGDAVPPEVWVCFQPKTPKISLEPWQAGQAYYFNDRVLHNGDTWRCVNAQNAGEPGTGDSVRLPWERVRVPEMFTGLIRDYVRAAFMEDEQGRAQLFNRFEKELEACAQDYRGATGHVEIAVFEDE